MEASDETNREQVLMEPWVMEFTYNRTTGPVIGRFLNSLKQRKIEGLRTLTGRVVVPPTGYDPDTSEDLLEWVEVGHQGTVLSWTWVPEPLPTHRLQVPFAWALIRLDGADSMLLHMVKGTSESQMSTGLRVEVCWSLHPQGMIFDIDSFQPVPEPVGRQGELW